MATLEMGKLFTFSKEEVDKQVVSEKCGNYALGKIDKEGAFVVQYVGRSDTDLKKRLLSHFDDKDKYYRFKFSYAKDAKEAFEKECKNWHDFGGAEGSLINKIHPDRPNETYYKCPICGK